ncbi:hypothetical protein [Amycolatopsis sp. FDAARGOS 1241]|uniref:hypothetical protein n=1 Tax=Amycolatopsis sp. FDAARGOS 1241 TaxID=2778070 RepID=UPI00195123E6|nr:hypothetical protein [Amycolatopsis sp. FDAARGOS 1241]QRP45622.1 hypothetical protein I6J71_42040 [Amycolatopsis sp. FDAARGOS 1241]
MTSTVTRPETSAPAGGADAPPPEEPEGRSGIAGLLELPAQAVRAVVRTAKTTPGRLSVIAVGVVLLSLVAGLIATLSVHDKDDTIEGLIDHREPLAVAAQQVFRSLSDADATAATTFLSVGAEPPELRQKYEQDIAEAGSALAKAASDTADVGDAAHQVDILNQKIPVYTGIVETARANNRQGFPSGASYLREASQLMRSTILPAAEALYNADTQKLSDEQDDSTSFPWAAVALLLVLVAALVVTQVYLTRKTNRVLNIGLLVATACVIVSMLWGAVALIFQGTSVASGKTDGTSQVDVLVRARIAALQARADETLTLVARGDGQSYDQQFITLAEKLVGADGQGGLLGQARDLAQGTPGQQKIEAAEQAAREWSLAHLEVRKLDDSGQYQQAVDFATSVSQGSAAAAFARLDANLQDAIEVCRQEFLDDTQSGERWLTALAPGVAVLAVLAAGGVTVGVRERLREYR